jgi:hypothetical protein
MRNNIKNNLIIDTHWHALTDEGNAFVTKILTEFVASLENNETTTDEDIHTLFKAFYDYECSPEGAESEIWSKETVNPFLEFVEALVLCDQLTEAQLLDMWHEYR